MKAWMKFVFLFCSLTALSSCKKGMPEIQNLRGLSGFSLDQTSFTVASKTNPSFVVTGTCVPTFQNIEISFDGGNSWREASSVAGSSVIQCETTGKFQLDFSKGLQSFIEPDSLAAKGTLLFRGTSTLGLSEALAVTLRLRETGGLILAGSHSTLSNGYQLSGRVGGTLTAKSGGYTLKGTVKHR